MPSAENNGRGYPRVLCKSAILWLFHATLRSLILPSNFRPLFYPREVPPRSSASRRSSFLFLLFLLLLAAFATFRSSSPPRLLCRRPLIPFLFFIRFSLTTSTYGNAEYPACLRLTQVPPSFSIIPFWRGRIPIDAMNREESMMDPACRDVRRPPILLGD